MGSICSTHKEVLNDVGDKLGKERRRRHPEKGQGASCAEPTKCLNVASPPGTVGKEGEAALLENRKPRPPADVAKEEVSPLAAILQCRRSEQETNEPGILSSVAPQHVILAQGAHTGTSPVSSAYPSTEQGHPGFAHFPSLFPSGAGITAMTNATPLHLMGRRPEEGDHSAGCVLVAAQDGSIALLHYASGQVRQRWTEAHDRGVLALSTPQPSSLCTAASSSPSGAEGISSGKHAIPGERRREREVRVFLSASRDKTVKLWKLDPTPPDAIPRPGHTFSMPHSPLPLATCAGHTLSVTCVDHHPNGTLAVSGSRDNTVRLWDLQREGQEVYCGNIKLNLVHFVQFLPGMSCVAQGGEDRTIRIWDLRCGQSRAALALSNTLEGMEYFTTCALSLFHPAAKEGESVWSTDPYHLVTGHTGVNGCGSYVKEWDLRTPGRELCTHLGHRSAVLGLRPTTSLPSFSRTSVAATPRSAGDAALPHGSGGLGVISGSVDSVLRWWELGSSGSSGTPPAADASNAVTISEGRMTCFTTSQCSPPLADPLPHNASRANASLSGGSGDLCAPVRRRGHPQQHILQPPAGSEDVVVGLDNGSVIVLAHTHTTSGQVTCGAPKYRYRFYGEMNSV